MFFYLEFALNCTCFEATGLNYIASVVYDQKILLRLTYIARTISWSPKRLWRGQNNGHSWSLDDVITDTNHILKSHSLCFRVALRFTRLTLDKKIEIERTHIWLNGYGMSVVNMLEIRFSSLFTYTRWAYNVYLLFVKEKVSVCATDANDFLLLMIKRQSLK